MSPFTESGRAYSSEEIVKDPQAYMTDARRGQHRAAHIYVTHEIARRATSYKLTTADLLARLVVRVAVVGVGISLAVFMLGYLSAR